MNKNLRRKLIVSTLSLGVAAASVTASTYAWFVSNTSVETGTISGEAEAANANLAISTAFDGTFSVKSEDITLSTKLAPVAYDSTTDNQFELANGTKATSGYATFNLYFNVTNLDATKETAKISLKNVTAFDTDTTHSYTAIKDVEEGGSKIIEAGTSYTDDITKALMLSYKDAGVVTKAEADIDVADCGNYFEVNNAAATYDGDKYWEAFNEGKTIGAAAATTANGSFTPASVSTDGKNTVTPGAQVTGAGQDYTVATVTDNGKYCVQFCLWLDGNDKACWDAIAQHTFTIALTFELTTAAK